MIIITEKILDGFFYYYKHRVACEANDPNADMDFFSRIFYIRGEMTNRERDDYNKLLYRL